MRTVGKYELLDLLGRGGCGEVWRARDAELGRVVALKLLQRTNAEDLARFRREAHAVARLSHPHIAQLYEFSADPPFLAMQFVEGEPISKPEHLAQAARAVQAAHDTGILHRDLKPANILVSAERAYVLDFGLAREVQGDQTAMSLTGDILGTPSYMSPEQARGEVNALDARTDVYGLGATLYALLMGCPPHTGPSAYGVVRKVIEADPAPPPGELGVIAMKALEKDPARRYATAAEFAEDLDRHFRNEPIRARPASLAYRLRKQVARRPAVWGLSATLAAAILGGGTFGVAQLARVAAERGAKVREQEARLATEERLRSTLQAQVESERAAAERARVVGVMEASYRRLTQWDEDMAAAQSDAELEAIRAGVREMTGRLQAELPNHPEEASSVWYLIAEGCRVTNREDEALAAYDESLTREPSDWGRTIGVESRAALGRALARMGTVQDMIIGSEFDQSRRLQAAHDLIPRIEEDLVRAGDRDAPPRLRKMVHLWGLYLTLEAPSWDRVTSESGDEIARGGRNEGFYLLDALVRGGADRESALTASLDRHRGRARAWLFLGIVRRDRGDFARAIEAFNEAIRLHPGYAEAFSSRGRAYSRAGDPVRAIADFDEAIRLQPDHVDAHNNRGNARLGLGDRAGAIADFDEAIRLRPDNPEPHNNRGSAHYRLGDFSQAVADYSEAIRLNPEYAEALFNRAMARHSLGEIPAAIADYSRAIDLRPDWSTAY